MPWAFLVVTLVGAVFTFNAYLPRRSQGILSIPSFFAGWLTGELALHHFAWQAGATVLFVGAGALSAWPGWLGLGITLASWAALLALVPISQRSRDTVERALAEGLGGDHARQIAPGLSERLVEPTRLSRMAVLKPKPAQPRRANDSPRGSHRREVREHPRPE